DRVSGSPLRFRPGTRRGSGGGSRHGAHDQRRLPDPPPTARHRRRVRRAADASDLMRFRRHIPPVHEWKLPWKLPELSAMGARRWALALGGAMVAGYLTALLLVPAPLLHGHGVVPRVLGLSLQEASDQLRKADLQVQDGGTEPHPTAPQGVIIWQDPPPGVSAPAGLRVTLVSSEGPPKIAVPDVAGLEAPLAQRLITAAGLRGEGVLSGRGGGPRGRGGRVGPGGRALWRRDADAPGRDDRPRSRGARDGGRQPRAAHDRGARSAWPVPGGRADAPRAGRSRAGHGNPAPNQRRESGHGCGTKDGGGYARRPRDGGRYRGGAEPSMTKGIPIVPSILSADLTRLAEQVKHVIAGGAD